MPQGEPVVVRAGRTRNTQCSGWPQRAGKESQTGGPQGGSSVLGVLELGATWSNSVGIHTPNSVLIAPFLSPPQPQCLVLTGPPTSARPWWTLPGHLHPEPQPDDLWHVSWLNVLCREGGLYSWRSLGHLSPPRGWEWEWGGRGPEEGLWGLDRLSPFLFLSLASPHCLTPLLLLPPSSSWPSPA